MKRRQTWAVAAVMALLAAMPAAANNLWVTNTTVVTGVSPSGTTVVQFDMGWDNSWRHAFNHDAAWVFFKFKIEGDASEGWRHATLSGTGTNPASYSAGTGTPMELVIPSDRAGLFVRRAPGAPVAGSVAVTNVRAVVDLAGSGISRSARIRVQTLAVEMVYVAEGAFWAGDGLSASTFTPTWINTNDPTVTAVLSGGKYQGGRPYNQTAPTNLWPNGYGAFYCMKHELTQGQYVDFVNMLTTAQKNERGFAGTSFRLAIGVSGGFYTATYPDRALTLLSWADGAAFAAWAGLRPMTELEFEKACRGPLDYIAGEFAWGTATIVPDGNLAFSGTENGTETITSDVSLGAASYNYRGFTGGSGGQGPYRVGIFATNGSTRVSAGASYWGILDLSGNVYEQAVRLDQTEGQAFTGQHGSGTLANNGYAGVLGWPVTAAVWKRGGAWRQSGSGQLRVSDRAVSGGGTARDTWGQDGFRAVRTAP